MSNEKQEADARYYQGLSGTPGVEERLADLATKVEAMGNDDRLPAVEYDVVKLTEKVAQIDNCMKAFNSVALHKRIETSDERLAKLEAQVEINEGGVNDLAGRVSGIEAHILFGDPITAPDTPPLQPEAPESEVAQRDLLIHSLNTWISRLKETIKWQAKQINAFSEKREDDRDVISTLDAENERLKREYNRLFDDSTETRQCLKADLAKAQEKIERYEEMERRVKRMLKLYVNPQATGMQKAIASGLNCILSALDSDKEDLSRVDGSY
jgi:predicted RNase H-like nuclease (RuvC/YqgF family)